jgi:hypothetical protein
MVSPSRSARPARPVAAPMAAAAMMLWPQAWPSPGSASYSAQIPMCSSPVPMLAVNAVGSWQAPRVTA